MAAPEPAPRLAREREREDESEDESDILEESPCGRWQKRREEVNQGNMPGLQSTFLAMDTEEGVEVVWNELHFRDRKAFAAHEEKIQTVFEQLVLVDHPNIVKLHKYWLDTSEACARVIMGEAPGRQRPQPGGVGMGTNAQLVEILSSHPAGHLHHRVRVIRQPQAIPQKNQEEPQGHERPGMGSGLGQPRGQDGVGAASGTGMVRGCPVASDRDWARMRGGLRRPSRLSCAHPTESCVRRQAWKRWCTQILSALSFLHACSPPIIHGNLTSDTIFIQHNGLIKIGSVWHRIFSNALPHDLRSPIRAEREELRNLHFFPPEYGEVADGTAVDIFSFGMCALEMAVLEIQANGDTRVTEEAIARARHSLSDPNMREFILCCLARDPARRPSAHSLLFHRVLFEVHSLKLLAAHCFIQHQYLMPENVVEEKTKAVDLHAVLAELPRPRRPPLQWRYSEVSFMELDKFLEDVRNGIYPLMNFAATRPLGLPRVLAPPLEEVQKAKTPTPEPFDSETRKVIQMQCNLERSEDKARWHLTLLLVLEDRLHRQLTYDLLPTDSPQDLASELVHYGFLHEDDRMKLAAFLESTFLKYRGAQA
ncbi:nuclear receptor-binding protein 2 isoform X1 [Macaca thibetana thibetana]|uniref:nuclear receptor-binding protein 2 isoform X1 n=1 Tax=Macaca mulatta TaxID=9544 RepID=UPI0010A1FC93|nr:nuclear receptor-binding protein 2 isoform X1 [Macaca fascicularis]XP_028708919.1 nuclear receptor-binding protein 2 isoform X1 [Macaca mulatta]XP_050656850.1 nuclear receptor-binding protein 2 isoform X1 [Macaca thibetana thibetana]